MKPPDLPPEKSVMQVKKEQLELDMEQQIGSKLGKEYVKAICCHPAYLSYMQAGIKIAGRKSVTSDMQMTTPLQQKVKKN